jgi:YidC/Oxa1 family membrane protein insertase
MDFDKNTVIGIALIVLIFFGFSIYTSREEAKFREAQKEKAQQTANSPVQESVKPDTASAAAATTVTSATDTAAQVAAVQREGIFASASNGEEQLITIENEDCIYTFTNRGGVIKQVELKGYETFDKKPLILFRDNGNSFNLTFFSNDSKAPVQTERLYFTTSTVSQKIDGDKTLNITYTLADAGGKRYEHHYTLNGKGYAADFTVHAVNLGAIIPKNTSYFTLNWNQSMPSQEGGIDDQRANATVYYENDIAESDYLSMGKDVIDEKIEEPLKWVSFKQKFFNTAIIAADKSFSKNALLTATIPNENKQTVKNVAAVIQLPFDGSNEFSFPMQLYMGPNKFKELKAMKADLSPIIPLGGSILGLINKYFIIPIFHFFSKFSIQLRHYHSHFSRCD